MDAAPLDIEDRAACERYLVATGHAQAGDVVEHKLLAGGVSCATVLVAFADGRRWVLKQALAKLRVKADWFSDPNRIHREALGMRVLGELAPPGSIPKLIFDDDAHHVIGMEAVPDPHENWKTMLMDGRAQAINFSEFGQLLAAIHGGSYVFRREYEPQFADRSFFEALRIEPYYEYSARHDHRASDFLAELIRDTRAQRLCLVHGDYSPKNILICNNRLVLLDHEVIHWGDPAFDVGFAMTHLLVKTRFSELIRHHLENNFLHDYEFSEELNNAPCLKTDEYRQRCMRHTLGCLLARAIGRSPLEYLNSEARRRQGEVAVALIRDLPSNMPELIERFTKAIDNS